MSFFAPDSVKTAQRIEQLPSGSIAHHDRVFELLRQKSEQPSEHQANNKRTTSEH
ncbi:MAG: hypothetical protein IJ171_02875 [Ruminococcus sp.]|nr:hypothetical protein [Ruminococcus sp.]